MKRKKYYTFIIAKNSSSHLKKIIIDQKYVHIFLSALCALFLLFVVLLTDYLGLYVDQWKLSQLKKENKQLEQKFAYVDNQLNDLEKKFIRSVISQETSAHYKCLPRSNQ